MEKNQPLDKDCRIQDDNNLKYPLADFVLNSFIQLTKLQIRFRFEFFFARAIFEEYDQQEDVRERNLMIFFYFTFFCFADRFPSEMSNKMFRILFFCRS